MHISALGGTFTEQTLECLLDPAWMADTTDTKSTAINTTRTTTSTTTTTNAAGQTGNTKYMKSVASKSHGKKFCPIFKALVSVTLIIHGSQK